MQIITNEIKSRKTGGKSKQYDETVDMIKKEKQESKAAHINLVSGGEGHLDTNLEFFV